MSFRTNFELIYWNLMRENDFPIRIWRQFLEFEVLITQFWLPVDAVIVHLWFNSNANIIHIWSSAVRFWLNSGCLHQFLTSRESDSNQLSTSCSIILTITMVVFGRPSVILRSIRINLRSGLLNQRSFFGCSKVTRRSLIGIS